MTPHEGSGQVYGVRRAALQPRQDASQRGQGSSPDQGPIRLSPPEPVFSLAEDSHSGRVRTLGKRVGVKPSGVQIPYPPPVVDRL